MENSLIWNQEELDFINKNKEDLDQTTNYSNFCDIWRGGSKISYSSFVYSSRSKGFSNFYNGSFPLFSLAYKLHNWGKTDSGLFLWLVKRYDPHGSPYFLVRLGVFNESLSSSDWVELFSYENYDKDIYSFIIQLRNLNDPPVSFREKLWKDFKRGVYWEGREIFIPWFEDTYMHCPCRILR